MMSAQGSPSRDHPQDSQGYNGSNESSTPSDSMESHIPKLVHCSSYLPYPGSPSRGRSYRRRDTSAENHFSSSSSVSASTADNWPFSVRDIEDLDAVINKHLDDLAQMIADIEKTEDTIECYAEDVEDLNWQLFLFRTGACSPRSGSEGEPWERNADSMVSEQQYAARQKHKASEYLELQESICAEAVSMLFRLLRERSRRNRVAVGKRGEGQ